MSTLSATAPRAPVATLHRESAAQVLARLRFNLKPISAFADLSGRGIWGFSFVFGPNAEVYTRLHVTDDYSPVSCRLAEQWFEVSGARKAFCSAMADAGVPDFMEVAGVYSYGFKVHHIRECY